MGARDWSQVLTDRLGQFLGPLLEVLVRRPRSILSTFVSEYATNMIRIKRSDVDGWCREFHAHTRAMMPRRVQPRLTTLSMRLSVLNQACAR